jgi:phage tail tape-measure protein
VTAQRIADAGFGGTDYLGAGLGTYSALTDSFYTAAGIRSASFFGVKYGLAAVLSDIPGGVAGLIGVFQTGSAYSSGDYLGASQAGGATLGGIAGAEAGAAAGSLFGPFDVVTTPVGAVIGGVAGGYYGGRAGGSIYNTGFMPLDQPSVPPPPPAY